MLERDEEQCWKGTRRKKAKDMHIHPKSSASGAVSYFFSAIADNKSDSCLL